MLEKHGAKLEGSWATLVGSQDEITNLWGFESSAAFEAFTQSIVRDPELISLTATLATMLVQETNKLIVPLKCSPFQ